MMDMLVRLYDLPDIEEDLRRLEREGFLIRRPGAYERHLVEGTLAGGRVPWNRDHLPDHP